jgi:hypothetical protein
MWNPWPFVCCQIAGQHRWERVGDEDDYLDTGWRCRDCDELVLMRYVLERNHDPDVGPPYGAWGAGGGAMMPGS